MARSFARIKVTLLTILLLPIPMAYADRVAFTGKDANGDDEFAFVALETIPNGTEIFFTNNDWNNATGQFLTTSNEQTVLFTASAEIAMGTVVRITEVSSTQVFDVAGASGTAVLVSGGSGTVSADPHYAFAASNAGSPLDSVIEIYAYMDTDPDNAGGSTKDPRIGMTMSPGAVVVDFIGVQPVNTDFGGGRSTALLTDLTNPQNFINDSDTDITLDLSPFTGLIGEIFSDSFEFRPGIRLWLSASTTDGAVGGRAGGDAFCDADANKPMVSGSITRAFLSFDASDEIRDMPANYAIPVNDPVFRANGGTRIADSFGALLNADMTPLINTVGGATTTYTGSGADGSLVGAFACINWTSDNAANSGLAGDSNRVNQFFLTGSATTCDMARPLYCITFTPEQPTQPN